MCRDQARWIVTVLSLAIAAGLCVPTVASAQFTEWEVFSVPDPFSVTTVVRGLNTTLDGPEGPTVPQVRFEALVGYFGGAQNQFDYHSSVALSAPVNDASGARVVNTREMISFSTSGVQSILNGLCCSNNAVGLDDNRSIHALTDFATGESWEVVIGTPQAAGAPPLKKRRIRIAQPKNKETN